MSITVLNNYTITVANTYSFSSAITTFLDYIHSGMPKTGEEPEIRFDTLILRKFCPYNGYVLMGENSPKAHKRTFVATFSEQESIKVKTPADVEVGLRRFVLDKKLLVLTLIFDERPSHRIPAGELELWKADGEIFVYAKGMTQTPPIK